MSFEISIEFRFESAHFLPQAPENHKCRRLHGHSFVARVAVEGELDSHGWVVDYAAVRNACDPVKEALDHRLLNDVEGLENPTSEVLAKWIFDQLVEQLPSITSVELRETCDTSCIYRP